MTEAPDIDDESIWKVCTLCGLIADERELTYLPPIIEVEAPTYFDLLGDLACETCLKKRAA